MKKNSNIQNFVQSSVKAFFTKGTDASNFTASKIAKVATVLSVAGAMALSVPSQAEARGGGNLALGLIGGLVIGSMIRVQPSYGQQYQQYPQQQYIQQPQIQYQQYPQFQQQQFVPAYNNGGGRPGNYYCPRGPQSTCYLRNGALEGIAHDTDFSAAEPEFETAAPSMG